jgi:chain length determinant protein EpsF
LGVANNAMAKTQFNKATKGAGDIRHWFADQFTQNLKVNPSQESSVIEVSYEGADPKFVAAMANTFAEAYIDTNLQLKIEPAKQAAIWFDSQIKALRLNVEQAQTKLSTYQQENGIAFADARLDTEASRLSELSSQLVAAQAQTYESNSRQNQLKRGNAGESPDILSNSLIQGLKSQLAAAETKLSDVSQRLGENHPQYQAAITEVENLKSLIISETIKTSSSVGQLARVSQQRESEIKSSLAKQKAQVLKLKDQHDQMAVLMREVESAQRIYDSALLRFGQTNMEGQSSQTDVSILNPAIPPIKHSSPNITLNIILSMFLGSLLALGFAIAAEMLDRRVRTHEDLEQLLDLPVLHVISESNRSSTRVVSFLRQLFSKNKTNKNAGSRYQFL